MNPWQIAKDSESSHQQALFCFCAKAEKVGFTAAKDPVNYKNPISKGCAVNELAFFHHIPNGGSRGDSAKSAAIAGGRLKAEGVKAGVLDCFWPLVRGDFHGLYIEMKRPAEKKANNPQAGCSKEQLEFGQFVFNNGYHAVVCYTWLEAAEVLESYYNLKG